MCGVLENRSKLDEERMDQLTNQLKEARMLAEDADSKSEEVKEHHNWLGCWLLADGCYWLTTGQSSSY